MLNIPAGYKLVPIEPTDEMETAAEDDYEQRGETFPDWKAKYRAMLVAAPTPPAATQDEPITVTIEPESRGVSVGVWQGSRCIYTGAHAVPVAQGDAQDEQAAFEDWLERTCPSGDVEAVQRQWEASSDYADFYGLVPAPAAGDALDAARWRAYAKLFPEVSASFLATHAVDGVDPLPTIKGAAITGGYVVVTPAGWGEDKPQKVRDAILRLFPVNPAYTPKPETDIAAQQGKGGEHA